MCWASSSYLAYQKKIPIRLDITRTLLLFDCMVDGMIERRYSYEKRYVISCSSLYAQRENGIGERKIVFGLIPFDFFQVTHNRENI